MADNMIALQAMLPKIDTPFEAQGKALQLRQMMNASQDADYERQQRAQAAQDDASYRQALQANPTGGAGLLSALAGSGNYKAHAAAVKSDLDQRKGNADIAQTEAQTNDTKLKTLNQAFTLHRDQINLVNDPQTAAQWVASAYKDPVLGPLVAQSGPLDEVISRIPQDPAGFAKWKMQAGLNANDYVKQTSVDANTAANNAVSRENSVRSAASSKYSADSSAGTARARLAFDKQKDETKSTGAEPSMTHETISRLARQVLRGDRTGLANMGRGAQGAANLVAVQNAVTQEGVRQGMSPEDITAKSAELEGLRTGLRATGNISARVENAIAEADQLIPLALEASGKVSRSGFLPFGKAQVMFNTQTNDPEMARFAAANIGLATAYASAMARGNKPTVSDMEHGRELLLAAKSPEAYAATVEQMKKEMVAASAAPRVVREHLKGEIQGKKAPAAKLPSGWSMEQN